MKNRLLHAYKQAPWRIQLQWIGIFLLGLVLVASITGVYLNISAQAATAGRMIQFIENDIDEIHNEIAELTTDVAKTKSTANMLKRAEELGFRLIDPKQALFLEIPGYDPQADIVLAPPRVSLIAESPIVRSSYKLSLWDWLKEQIWQVSTSSIQPEVEVAP